MKISFTTKVPTEFTFQGKLHTSWKLSTVFAINTEKITAWKFFDKKLHIWFEGCRKSICLHENSPELGNSKDNFLSLLLYLQSEYEDFDDLIKPFVNPDEVISDGE